MAGAINIFWNRLVAQGISVQDEVANQFEIGNNDSYGCFIVRGLDLLRPGGILDFIVSNTFLTTRTHRQLREKILIKSMPQMALSRYFDVQVEIPSNLFGVYSNPTVFSTLRMGPPKIQIASTQSEFFNRNNSERRDRFNSFSTGRTSLSQYCVDDPLGDRIIEGTSNFGGLQELGCLMHQRESERVPVVKLWQIATVLQGLATADDEHFLRKTASVIANARRRNIKSVPPELTIFGDRLARLSRHERENGVDVVDFQTEPHFVPFDKGGEQDTGAGEFRNFWTDID
ncbi:MAG: hypothetical protein A2Z20_08575 [Bdellovibrionales bacterium RBG_16_40_8]|nr:MAG: hypothetical protein A2Z20_08575 [Bdellovibrionales bacterium RBG_16_40_8]